MTVSTSANQAVLLGNGATTVFSFSFNNAVPSGQSLSEATYSVIYTNASGVETTLASSTYTLSFTAAAAGTLWGVGGTLTYPLVGSPIASGTTLTLLRTFSLTQTTTIANQGNFYEQVVEQALDTLEMQMQQVNSRTTQWRGTWASGQSYNVGDIVQDGANGAATNNYYLCLIGNTSGTWATDLGNGDWTISVKALLPTNNQAITLSSDVTGSGQTAIATTIAANAVTNAKAAQMAANTFKANPTGATANATDVVVSASTIIGRGSSGNMALLTAGTGLSIGTSTIAVSQTSLTNSLSGTVTLNNTGVFFDGPSVAQGSSGTWYASGTVSVIDTVGTSIFVAKLWDGTTIVDTAVTQNVGASDPISISLSGVFPSPAGNIKISVNDASRTTGQIINNQSGLNKDSTITVFRIG